MLWCCGALRLLQLRLRSCSKEKHATYLQINEHFTFVHIFLQTIFMYLLISRRKKNSRRIKLICLWEQTILKFIHSLIINNFYALIFSFWYWYFLIGFKKPIILISPHFFSFFFGLGSVPLWYVKVSKNTLKHSPVQSFNCGNYIRW